jgi:hypothetical protein
MEKFGLARDEMENLWGEAYRRAITANPERYPHMLTAPLPLRKADDESVGREGDERWGAADKPPNDADAREGGPLAFVRHLPTQADAAAQRFASMAWVGLKQSAGLSKSPPALSRQPASSFKGFSTSRPAAITKGKF